jgi:serine O-acetyltransferase
MAASLKGTPGREPGRLRELDAAVDAVAASYTGKLEIDNLESAALPNKRMVIEAIQHLKPVLFLGFYSTKAIGRDSLRDAIAEHLHPAYRALVDQIERALRYTHWTGRACDALSCRASEDVVLALFADLPELRRQLNADVKAAYDGDPAAKNVEEIIFSYPSIEALVAYRIANRLHKAGVPMIPRIITEHAHSLTGIDISPGASIGERFFIDHGTGVVIGETTVIGNDVKLYQGVTLGALSVPHREEMAKKRHPTIEDGVTVYAGATILGGETVIGSRSIIGGNVWLTKSVPPDSRVFGRSRSDDR